MLFKYQGCAQCHVPKLGEVGGSTAICCCDMTRNADAGFYGIFAADADGPAAPRQAGRPSGRARVRVANTSLWGLADTGLPARRPRGHDRPGDCTPRRSGRRISATPREPFSQRSAAARDLPALAGSTSARTEPVSRTLRASTVNAWISVRVPGAVVQLAIADNFENTEPCETNKVAQTH